MLRWRSYKQCIFLHPCRTLMAMDENLYGHKTWPFASGKAESLSFALWLCCACRAEFEEAYSKQQTLNRSIQQVFLDYFTELLHDYSLFVYKSSNDVVLFDKVRKTSCAWCSCGKQHDANAHKITRGCSFLLCRHPEFYNSLIIRSSVSMQHVMYSWKNSFASSCTRLLT